MDRNWVNADRLSKEYKNGVRDFCEHVAKHVKDTRFILCPCQKCLNIVEVDGIAKLEEHLRCDGIDKTYTCWTYHGENKGEYSSSNMKSKYQSEDIMDTYVFGHTEGSNSSNKNDVPNVFNEELRDHHDMDEKLKDDAALSLWPGCTKFSKLSAVLTLYNLKVGHQVSDVFFTEMLIAVSELLLDGNVLPRRTYEAKQMLKSIGLVHNRIHYCPNDCILYRKEYADLDQCPKCSLKRYKNGNSPAKVMCGRIDGEGVTRGQQVEVDRAQWYQAHLCVLHNTVDVVPYVDLHKQTISAENPRKVDKKWSIVVLSNKLNNTYQVGDGVDEEIDNIDDPFVRVNIPTNMDEEEIFGLKSSYQHYGSDDECSVKFFQSLPSF
ncbi:hypothetical protein POM88_053573 [Heracleum sosnowskyi]|uniref:Transposase-associated domain-containing protein n=1 Tax=Heracleum sosnowskyi TaxID=360622 RepID=A0AAD8LXZ4_9APIA|nr:hypothetical protein POM88_053573 [Heracleum sosnowskyi]